MPKLTSALPKYRKHSNGKQAIVTLSGTTHYLGLHGSKASLLEYDRRIAQWLSAGRQPLNRQKNYTLSIVELAAESRSRYISEFLMAYHFSRIDVEILLHLAGSSAI